MSFSGFDRYVSHSYKVALGTGLIKGRKYKNTISAVITDLNFWPSNSASFKGKNIRYKNLKTYNTYNSIKGKNISSPLSLYPTGLSLNNVDITTFNSETFLKSEISYEQISNQACSSQIFLNNKDSWIKNDLDYSPTAYKDPNTSAYFINEYNFKTDYSKQEYRSYEVKENYLDENVITLTAEDFLLNNEIGNNTAMKYGAAGLLLLYTDDNHKNDNSIPMIYYNFPKVFMSNQNHLNIEWHADGLIKVE